MRVWPVVRSLWARHLSLRPRETQHLSTHEPINPGLARRHRCSRPPATSSNALPPPLPTPFTPLFAPLPHRNHSLTAMAPQTRSGRRASAAITAGLVSLVLCALLSPAAAQVYVSGMGTA